MSFSPFAFVPADEESNNVLGAEEVKDSGVLTTRLEYDINGFETTNIDSPPLGSQVEKRKLKKHGRKPATSAQNDINIDISATTLPANNDEEDTLNTATNAYAPFQTKASTKTPTAATKNKGKGNFGSRAANPAVPWYDDEHEWVKQLIADNMDKTWAWYADQDRIKFEGTQYPDPVTGKPSPGVRAVRTLTAVRERFVAWKKLQKERQGL